MNQIEMADLALVGMASLLPRAARLKDQRLADSLRLQIGAWSERAARPLRGDPERIMLWAQVTTGLEADELTAVRVLDAAAWQQRRQRLRQADLFAGATTAERVLTERWSAGWGILLLPDV